MNPNLLLTANNARGHFDTKTIVLIGIGKIIACHCYVWNSALLMGVVPFFCCNLYWSIGMICMSLCIAEMASALPFTGGIYGFVRGIIGPYLGFFVGIFEISCNLTIIAMFMLSFGASVNTSLGLPESYQLIFCPLPLILTATIHLAGSKRFGHAVIVLTVTALILFTIYVFGSLVHVDRLKYGNNTDAHAPSATYKMFSIFQYANFGLSFFLGLESIPVISSEAKKPHESIPLSMMVATGFYIITFSTVIFLSCYQYPGTQEVRRSSVPMSFGYGNIFHISHNTAAIFNVPATLASIMVSTYYLCVIIRSMSMSGLLPSVFNKTMGEDETPYVAMIFINVCAVFVAIVILIGVIEYPAMVLGIYAFSTYGLHFNYFAIFSAYIIFYDNYNDKQHAFQSPLGKYGAYLGIFIVAALPILNNFPWHPYMIAPLVAFICVLIAISIGYIRYQSRVQRFSPEEEKVFFVNFIIKSNRKHRDAIKHRRHHQAQHPHSPHSSSHSSSLTFSSFAFSSALRASPHNAQTRGGSGSVRSDSGDRQHSGSVVHHFNFNHPVPTLALPPLSHARYNAPPLEMSAISSNLVHEKDRNDLEDQSNGNQYSGSNDGSNSRNNINNNNNVTNSNNKTNQSSWWKRSSFFWTQPSRAPSSGLTTESNSISDFRRNSNSISRRSTHYSNLSSALSLSSSAAVVPITEESAEMLLMHSSKGSAQSTSEVTSLAIPATLQIKPQQHQVDTPDDRSLMTQMLVQFNAATEAELDEPIVSSYSLKPTADDDAGIKNHGHNHSVHSLHSSPSTHALLADDTTVLFYPVEPLDEEEQAGVQLFQRMHSD